MNWFPNIHTLVYQRTMSMDVFSSVSIIDFEQMLVHSICLLEFLETPPVIFILFKVNKKFF